MYLRMPSTGGSAGAGGGESGGGESGGGGGGKPEVEHGAAAVHVPECASTSRCRCCLCVRRNAGPDAPNPFHGAQSFHAASKHLVSASQVS